MAKVIPEGAVAPNAIVHFIVAQGTYAWILGGQTVVQFSEHFWRLTLRLNKSIQFLPRLSVIGWNRLKADCDVVAEICLPRDLIAHLDDAVRILLG
jgi:hypothetical protein